MTAPKGNIESAKSEIKRLIDAYEDLKKSGGIGSFNEDETCRKFILPLFHALGWDTEGKKIIDEVTGQKIAGGQKRVDYSFNVSGQPIMFLEAKQLSADLEDPQYAKQAINYGYSKTVKWVVLSDFEGIIVFNTLLKLKRERISERTVLKLKYTEYLDRIGDLWLLSKASFFEDKLNKHAQSIGHVTNKIPINELLLSKLLIWRNELINKIARDNEGLSKEEVAECVQRLLNRLIFIRTCEDREIDQRNLLRNLNKEWQSGDKRLDKMLQDIFRDFDEGYDSSLFEKHLVDTIKINSDLLFDVIGGLYEDFKEDVEFDFAVIDADILGSIYEQYLGTIQKGEGAKDKEKRKSHGIYYTPKYIVDYIVKNTLGKILEEAIKDKEYAKIGKLKVLDPACGSGSFLLKALEMFDDAYGKTPDFAKFPKGRKIKTLCNNIYGVDLDTEAVELTKLNLLLSSTYSRKKLPNLNHNIECGNSLIDDPEVAGDKAFDWKKRFKDVMDKGGFDVIIGNPPYIFARSQSFSEIEKAYYYEKYKLIRYQINTYLLFINRSLELLKEGGCFGFIVPNTWLTIDTFTDFRKHLLTQTGGLQVINIYDKVFGDANVDTCLLLLKKSKPTEVTLGEFRNGQLEIVGKLTPSKFEQKSHIINISLAKGKERISIMKKVESQSKPLETFAVVKAGLKAYETGKGKPPQTDKMKNERIYHNRRRIDKTYFQYLEGKDVKRYQVKWGGWWLKYGDCLAAPRIPELFSSPRILVRQIPSPPPHSINAVYTEEHSLNDINSMIIYKFKGIDPLFLLAVLNSKVMTFWFINAFEKLQRKIFPQFKVKELAIFPIPSASKNDQKMLSGKAKIMLELKERIEKVIDKQTSETDRLKRQIEEADREIDNLVYKLYGLTEEEIRVVENSYNTKRQESVVK